MRKKPRMSTSLTLGATADLILRCLKVPGPRTKVRQGSTLYVQGDPSETIFLVVDGLVKISMVNSDAQEIIIDIVGAGALCGEGAVFDGLPRFSSATALSETEVIRLTRAELRERMAEDRELADLIMTRIALKQRQLAVRLQNVTTSSPETRISELFGYIVGNSLGPRVDDVRIELTHEQIASLIGVSRVTVTRALRRLSESGQITTDRGRIVLSAPYRLL